MKLDRTFNTLGIVGYGAFGKLIAHYLFPHFDINVYDPAIAAEDNTGIDRINVVNLRSAASCDIVVLAVPVARMEEVIRDLLPYLAPDAIVVDVGSVKMSSVSAMTRLIPETVEVIGTHPLFGPQSAKAGIEGRKIVVCPVRGRHARRAGAFFRKVLGLNVIFASPEKHDREMAVVQGITHLVAKVLVEMEPLPTAMTTASFDFLMAAVDLVRYDSPDVFCAIEHENPFASGVRTNFADIINEYNRHPSKY
ncbi:prephenate dehydrogenase [Allorhizobium sp. BGMRC 0089]|uniref:prephenate dehydrogenase n=1 Tax=Allorhizobium sonneratiae TaxID=2934936 RepID=UPI0020337665|nr:prephenate dehydrogenase [Allorhizobium sonneratiae]MCM2292605.1 prephenate dehydrogenase [Allorhizobium sonneratiae]